jgi:hypothetical protein
LRHKKGLFIMAADVKSQSTPFFLNTFQGAGSPNFIQARINQAQASQLKQAELADKAHQVNQDTFVNAPVIPTVTPAPKLPNQPQPPSFSPHGITAQNVLFSRANTPSPSMSFVHNPSPSPSAKTEGVVTADAIKEAPTSGDSDSDGGNQSQGRHR